MRPTGRTATDKQFSIHLLQPYLVSNTLVVTVLGVLPLYPLVQSSAAALASDYTLEADRGKGLGFLESAISLGGGLGPLAGGLIADRLGLKSVTIFSLTVAFSATIASQFFLKGKLTRQTIGTVVQAEPP